MPTSKQQRNPLETEKIGKLLVKFCIPALASNLVTSVYNIVDQIFIGNVLGIVGNAATNVIFPAVTLVSALSLMCGVGASNAMNLHLGRGNIEEAKIYVSGGIGLMVLCGLILTVPLLIWTRQFLVLFGCTDTVLPYAMEYARIIALSFVAAMIGAGGSFLVRADGSPKFSLVCIAVGALSNVVLDAVFIFVFDWGIRGAAWATLIAEVISAVMVLWYLCFRFRSFPLFGRADQGSSSGSFAMHASAERSDPAGRESESVGRSGADSSGHPAEHAGTDRALRVRESLSGHTGTHMAVSLERKQRIRVYLKIAAIGFGPAFNFATQAVVQVFLNNSLRIYGAQSIYGSDVCLAAAGVAGKVNTLAVAMIVGLTNGLQPISSYNFGRKNYRRVAQAAKRTVSTVLILGCVVFVCYQLFPVQITAAFGDGDELYYEFASRFFRIFYLLIALFGLQTSVAGFFSSQGKVKQSILISLVRQVLFFPPLLILLPKVMGLDGVLLSGPISDFAMAAVAGTLFVREIRKLERMEEEKKCGSAD